MGQRDSYIRFLGHRVDGLLRFDELHQLTLIEMRLLEAVLDGQRDDDLARALYLTREQLRGIEQLFRLRTGVSVYEAALTITRKSARDSSFPQAS